jgi:DNA mismatch endonuclease (patch repair protein)
MPSRHSPPWPDVQERHRQVMRSNKSKNTKPEIVIRKMLHAMGYRFRLHRRDLPGTPDIVFPSRKAAIQVHGCFWHQHEGCRHGRVPSTRQDYWVPKLSRNVQRDSQVCQRLGALGWRLMIVWECDILNVEKTSTKLRHFLGPQGPIKIP